MGYKLNKSEINQLMSDYDYMGYESDYAKEDLKELISMLNGYKSPMKLYRIICADDINEINKNKIGSHFSLNKKNLINSHYLRGSVAGDCRGEKVFLVTVEADKNLMDVMETLSNNILYPHEEEVTIKGGGSGVKVLDIEELSIS